MKYFIRLIITIFSFTLLFSCRTKDAAPGPAGASDLTSQGTINGTLYFKNYKGDSIKEAFNYEYFETLNNNYFVSIYNGRSKLYGFTCLRRGISDSENRFAFTGVGTLDANGVPQIPTTMSIDYSYIKNMGNNLFTFGDYDYTANNNEGSETVAMSKGSVSTCSISNFSLDTLSGRVKFDYTVNYDYSNITTASRYFNQGARVKGSVDVVIPRKQVAVNDGTVIVAQMQSSN